MSAQDLAWAIRTHMVPAYQLKIFKTCFGKIMWNWWLDQTLLGEMLDGPNKNGIA